MNDSITNEATFFHKLNLLPNELICIIKEYIPLFVFAFTNKTNYFEYHHLIKKQIFKNCLNNANHIEKYIRYMIRRDYSFVFQQIMKENFTFWINMKKYIYKNVKYNNYINFLLDYCIENESDNCRLLIVNFLKEQGLSINHIKKKNSNINIRWRV